MTLRKEKKNSHNKKEKRYLTHECETNIKYEREMNAQTHHLSRRVNGRLLSLESSSLASSSSSKKKQPPLFGRFGGKKVEVILPPSRALGSGRTTISKNTNGGRQYPFPADYDVMVQQARQALQKAREDGVDLGEIQFPPGGLDLAPGDLEGNVECTLTATVLRKILRGMKEEEKITVLFPDPTELKLAKRGQTGMCAPDGVAPPEVFQTDPLFEDWRGELNYLDDPNAFSVSGLDKIFGKSATVNDRVDINEGNMFVCAYPSGNIAELTQTRLLYENIREENESDAPASKTKTKRKSLVVVNGELDRTRSNYYPWFWNKNEMEPLREFSQSFEGIYFIHNFKGTNPAVLFRCYPDDWRVFRRRPNDAVECVWSSSTRPKSLKEIALDVLPKFP
ncbi:unnamed protein product [Bathycoccus prasinos]